MANAGRVAIVPKGEYNSATAYKRLDLVRYNNAVYVAKKANTGVSPTKTDTWMLCIQNVTQEQYDAIINGTKKVGKSKEADNALKLENFTAKQVGESGARNLIPYPYRDTTNVAGGITFTDNGDGSVTVNGTATALAQFYFCIDIPMGLKPNTTYTLTGCPSGGSSGKTYQLRAILNYKLDNSAHFVDVGNGKTFTTPDEYSFIRIMIDVFAGTTIDNLTFKPMLELGSVAHPWRPYHFGGAEDAQTLNGKHASDFLLTTGGTATGELGTNKRFARHIPSYEVGTVPSSSVWSDGLTVYDKNGANLGGVQHAVYTNGTSATRLIAEQLVDGVSVSAVISAEVTADGRIFGTAPTPDKATDNSIKIATTAWVNKFMLSIIGNSSAVIQSTSAPSDTSAVWVDTANKVTKIYKDGAWTALT